MRTPAATAALPLVRLLRRDVLAEAGVSLRRADSDACTLPNSRRTSLQAAFVRVSDAGFGGPGCESSQPLEVLAAGTANGCSVGGIARVIVSAENELAFEARGQRTSGSCFRMRSEYRCKYGCIHGSLRIASAVGRRAGFCDNMERMRLHRWTLKRDGTGEKRPIRMLIINAGMVLPLNALFSVVSSYSKHPRLHMSLFSQYGLRSHISAEVPFMCQFGT